ncbi:MAG: Gfo/Idh/MocA family oxidoreductase, partial [Patescibacteria group bacterium]|nr:Gfo/Idh/MocA family oxidoreductase [Patescibacteria group bacterium]
MTRTWTRRDVLRLSGAALTTPYLVPSAALGLDGSTPPSETVRVGIIGCGGRARWMCQRDMADVKGIQVVAACDCQRQRAEEFVQQVAGDARWGVYDDFRAMIEKEKLDAVMAETTTHARAYVTIVAMQMGMDVYIEKPMCLTIAEGRAMVNAARKLGRVTQVGT